MFWATMLIIGFEQIRKNSEYGVPVYGVSDIL